MRFSQSATELTTAATDALLGGVCLAAALWLTATPTASTWKRALWTWVFGLLALGSFFGAVAHALVLSDSVQAALWKPLYLSLGVAVAFFLVGALHDWRGEPTARALLPWAVAAGVGFFAATELLGGAFLIFVVFEASAMLMALAIYLFMAAGARLAGAGIVAAGIGLSVIAAAVQASRLRVQLIVPFDHNGLFHLVQMGATIVLAGGLRRGLTAPLAQGR